MSAFVDQCLHSFGFSTATLERLKACELDVLSSVPAQRKLQLAQLLLRAALADLKGALGDVPFILLKGEPLEKRLFSGKLKRGTGDLDLLFLPGDMEAARDALWRQGYRTVAGIAPRSWANNQEIWQHARYRVVVELHWAPALPGVPPLPLGELFETREAFRFADGLEVDVLRWDWLFLHLALHFHHHQGFAKGLLDVAGWLDSYGATCTEAELAGVDQMIRDLGLHGLVQWPLHTIYRLTGRRPPLLDDDVDMAVRAWALASSRAMKNCLCQAPRSEVDDALVAAMSELEPLRGVSLQALSMLTLDGWPQRLSGFCRPFVLGPHAIGREVDRLRRLVRR